MQRRPIVLASAALSLFLLYCVSLLRIPSVERVPSNWSHLWSASNDNGTDAGLDAAPAPEGAKEPAPASDPLSLGMNAPKPHPNDLIESKCGSIRYGPK